MHVLLLENNQISVAESLLQNLEADGHHVYPADTPQTAIQTIEQIWPNLVVVNSAGGGVDLSDYHQAFSATRLNIPHLVVDTPSELTRNVAREVFVIEPNSPDHLTQGIQKVMEVQEQRFLRLPELVIDTQERRVKRQNGQHFSLTPKEFKLLYLLVTNSNQVMSRKTIMQEVWDTDYMGDTRTLDVHIRWLREKIEEKPSQPVRLVTIRGVGYRFLVDTP